MNYLQFLTLKYLSFKREKIIFGLIYLFFTSFKNILLYYKKKKKQQKQITRALLIYTLIDVLVI